LNIRSIGDVFGPPGREALLRWLARVRDELVRLVDGPLSRDEYEKLLRERGTL